jgi:hypothetical protein
VAISGPWRIDSRKSAVKKNEKTLERRKKNKKPKKREKKNVGEKIEEETVAVTIEFKLPVPDAERFSLWSKLLRATAWCNRFVKN